MCPNQCGFRMDKTFGLNAAADQGFEPRVEINARKIHSCSCEGKIPNSSISQMIRWDIIYLSPSLPLN